MKTQNQVNTHTPFIHMSCLYLNCLKVRNCGILIFNEMLFLPIITLVCVILFFFKHFIYLFLDRGKGREKDKERNIKVWLPLTCPTLGNLAHKPGMCPYWELNW